MIHAKKFRGDYVGVGHSPIMEFIKADNGKLYMYEWNCPYCGNLCGAYPNTEAWEELNQQSYTTVYRCIPQKNITGGCFDFSSVNKAYAVETTTPLKTLVKRLNDNS